MSVDARPRPPAATDDARGRRLGHLLVALQLLLIGALALWSAPVFLAGRAGAAAWALAAASAALGAWALASNRPGNFNVHPAPRAGGQLVQHGPYRWLRHPMYTAVLLGAAACAAALGHAAAWGVGLALLVVLVAKARLEERWLLVQHAGYAAYRARTARFLPGLW